MDIYVSKLQLQSYCCYLITAWSLQLVVLVHQLPLPVMLLQLTAAVLNVQIKRSKELESIGSRIDMQTHQRLQLPQVEQRRIGMRNTGHGH